MIEDIMFILTWALLPIIWHYMLRVAGLSLFRLTIPSFTIASFYVFQYIGLPILYFQLNSYRAQFVTDKYIVMQVAGYTSITISLMIIGFILGRHHYGRLYWDLPSHYLNHEKITSCFQEARRTRFFLYLTILICSGVLILYLQKIGFRRVAFVVALGLGDDISISAARSAMGNAFEGKYHWYKLFMRDVLIFSFLALYAQYLIKKTLSNKLLLMVTFILATFSLVMATEKGPFVNFILALFLIYVFVRHDRKIFIRSLFKIGILILVVLSFFYILFMGTGSFFQGIVNTFSRAFTGQIQPAYHYLEFFPAVHDYLMGRSFPNPRGVFPFEHFPITKEVMSWLFPELAQRGVVGSAPTVYWGEMYANFGLLGIFIPPFFIGYGLYLLNFLIFRMKPNPLSIALMVWLLMYFKSLSGTSLSNYLFNVYFLSIVIIFLSASFFIWNGKFKYRGRISMARP